MNLVRTAVHDIVPSENPKGRFMYWDQRDPDAIVDMFWARHGADLGAEVSWAGSKEALLFKFRHKIRETANNERSIQTISIRKLYLSKVNREWALCLKTMSGEVGGDKDPPAIPKALLQALTGADKEDPDPIQTLRSLIFSEKMYTNAELYRRWCEGIESCQLRGTTRKKPTAIAKLITIAHEAHMRLEVQIINHFIPSSFNNLFSFLPSRFTWRCRDQDFPTPPRHKTQKTAARCSRDYFPWWRRTACRTPKRPTTAASTGS